MDKIAFFYNLGYEMVKEAKERGFSKRHPILSDLLWGGGLGGGIGALGGAGLGALAGGGKAALLGALLGGGLGASTGGQIGLIHGIGRAREQSKMTPKNALKRLLFEALAE